MLVLPDLSRGFAPLVSFIVEVLLYWQTKILAWWNWKPQRAILEDNLNEAKAFEEWEAAAYQLDEISGNDLWRQNPTSKFYDYRLIYERLQAIIEAREDNDVLALVGLLRSGLVRNLGNITTPRLFNRAYAGTKLLIEDYVTQVALAVEYVAGYPTSNDDEELTSQAKLDLLHDTRQAFGRSAVVLQGGAIFGLCHIGVVKALHLRGLLPRIIVGSATGALIAALVGVHTESELLDFLTGEAINLDAFLYRKKSTDKNAERHQTSSWIATLKRRIDRFFREGYLLDVGMLEQCVRSNIGDVTFEEAYYHTKRVLNITIPTDGRGDIPNLLNYLTAPKVVIWSAAIASNASAGPFFSPSGLLCKEDDGSLKPWRSSAEILKHSKPARLSTTEDNLHTPLTRVSELFNVNHFIISQARPYVAPFLQTGDVLSNSVPRQDKTRRKDFFWLPFLRIIVLELQHRFKQLDSLGFLHHSIRRFLIDDYAPGASITLVPELTISDFLRILERPTVRVVNNWIRRGERSVWPAISSLRVRCAIEVELDQAYQLVRRRKPLDVFNFGEQGRRPSNEAEENDTSNKLKGTGEKRKRKRQRAGSLQMEEVGPRRMGAGDAEYPGEKVPMSAI